MIDEIAEGRVGREVNSIEGIRRRVERREINGSIVRMGGGLIMLS